MLEKQEKRVKSAPTRDATRGVCLTRVRQCRVTAAALKPHSQVMDCFQAERSEELLRAFCVCSSW